ncbi:hypothetical protein [Streptococcus sp. 20925_1_69]|uniref:hypothetical protein n=1 Tax=Streptococcus sp. 20925_1_69 TaxID=3003661 RepID=UPI00352CF4AA
MLYKFLLKTSSLSGKTIKSGENIDKSKAELSALLGYEPYDKVGYNSGNSRNGTYSWKFKIQIFGVNFRFFKQKRHPRVNY